MLKFLKNALFNGLIILIPLVLLFITIRELIELMIAVATPIADMLPEEYFNFIKDDEVLAALLIVGTALLLGILAAIPASRAAGRFVEKHTVGRLPLYRMMKTFISAFLDMEDTDAFKPALVDNGKSGAEPAYVIEDNGGPLVVVLVPWSPASFAGSLKLVARERVHRLDLSLDEFSLSLANFGLGLLEMVPEEHAGTGSKDS